METLKLIIDGVMIFIIIAVGMFILFFFLYFIDLISMFIKGYCEERYGIDRPIKYLIHKLPYFKKKDEEKNNLIEKQLDQIKQNEKREKEKIILRNLEIKVWNNFGVNLDEVSESETQNEIVRNVNLIAKQTSFACVNQIKVNMGEKIEPYITFSDDDKNMIFEIRMPWNKRVDFLKKTWFNTRQLALQIIPNAKDKMPHFSEFEPLKSYNAEHLLQKKNK